MAAGVSVITSKFQAAGKEAEGFLLALLFIDQNLFTEPNLAAREAEKQLLF